MANMKIRVDCTGVERGKLLSEFTIPKVVVGVWCFQIADRSHALAPTLLRHTSVHTACLHLHAIFVQYNLLESNVLAGSDTIATRWQVADGNCLPQGHSGDGH